MSAHSAPRARAVRALLASALLLGACSGDGDGGEPCPASAVEACACPAGGYGTRTCAGAGWTGCACSEPRICPGGLSVAGTLDTSVADVAFSGAPVSVEAFYKQDADASEAGCIGRTVIRIGGERGCRLELEFGAVQGTAGGLRAVRFVADSFCPGFPDASEGTWQSVAGHGAWWAGPTEVAASASASADALCLPDTQIVFPDRTVRLVLPDGGGLAINLKALVISGDLAAGGDPSAAFACVVPACAEGLHDGGDGWCVAGGFCVPGYRDGGDGSCVPTGTCAPGFHDGGEGYCLPLGVCASGYHDGGDGSCARVGSCAPGYHDSEPPAPLVDPGALAHQRAGDGHRRGRARADLPRGRVASGARRGRGARGRARAPR